jgi:hypothetical protein
MLFVLAVNFSVGQQTVSGKLVGTWDVCQSYDTLNLNCKNPFTHFQLKSNGQFQGISITCGTTTEAIIATWKFEKGSIYISEYNGHCVKYPASGYYNIKFISDDIFYTESRSTVGENNGNPIFEVFKRRK